VRRVVWDGQAPFVLTVDNAKAYFDPSTLIKETKKTAMTMCMKLPRTRKICANFLRHQTHEKYVYRTAWGQRTGCLAQGVQILDAIYADPP
jgi:hypothetical protein